MGCDKDKSPLLPDGLYLVRCTNLEEKQGAVAPYARVTVVVDWGEYAGRPLIMPISYSPKAAWVWASALISEPGETASIAQLPGGRYLAEVRQETYLKQTRERVVRLHAVPDSLRLLGTNLGHGGGA